MLLPILPITILFTGIATLLTNGVFTTTHFSGYNGINPLYQLTNLCFKLHHWGILTLISLYILLRKPCDVSRFEFREVGLITTLVCFLSTIRSSSGFEGARLVSINIGLSNTLGQYHPPILFTYQTVTLIWIISLAVGRRPGLTLIRSGVPVTGLLVITAVMSAWWADQELFWGSFWNWDPVEVASIFILLGSIIPNHTLIYGMVDKKSITQLITRGVVCLSIVYLITRGPLANSVHMFTNSFLMRIDRPLYSVFIIIPVVYLLVLAYKVWYNGLGYFKPPRMTGTKPQSFVYKSSVIIAATLLLLLASTTNRLLGVSDKDFFKIVLVVSLILLHILGVFKYQKQNIHVRYDLVHLPLICLFPVLLVTWESPYNKLYTAVDTWLNIQIQCMGTSANIIDLTATNPYSIFQNKIKLLLTKHDTLLGYKNQHWVRQDIYSRPNNSILFFNINTRATAITATILWVVVKPKLMPTRWNN